MSMTPEQLKPLIKAYSDSFAQAGGKTTVPQTEQEVTKKLQEQNILTVDQARQAGQRDGQASAKTQA